MSYYVRESQLSGINSRSSLLSCLLQALKQHLADALKMLNVIRHGYTSFHNSMLKESKKLPGLLVLELDSYDTAICLHLGVVRQALVQNQSVCIINVHARQWVAWLHVVSGVITWLHLWSGT